MSREQKNRIDFFVVCVSAFAEKYNLSNAFAYRYLSTYKAIDFILENYDIEHTFSIDEVVDDMQRISSRNGGQIS